MSSTTILFCLFLVLIPYLYVRLNDAKLMRLPHEIALAFSPKRITARDALEAAAFSEKTTLNAKSFLPPRTGRRYIVVGGAGFLGGWIVRHLLERGEHPKQIRVLDIRSPTRPDLTTGLAKDVDFRLVDISDREQVQAAFSAPWPLAAPGFDDTDPDQGRGQIDNDNDYGDSAALELSADITVFHTAANIRFYERDPRLLHLSDKVNVEGTLNVLDAARAVGVSILIYTSSGSVSVRRTRLWLWPWEKRPVFWVQTIDDDDSRLPRRHEEMFSNYAASKIKAEGLVRAADKTPLAASVTRKGGQGQGQGQGRGLLRTGCLRPGNGIYGTGGDILCGAYLARQVNPSWAQETLQNFIYVENASLAHFCYERRLIEKAQGSTNSDIGGQAFAIVDAGPPVTYGDVYIVLTTLTDGQTVFPRLSTTAMLMLAHVLEGLYLLRSLAMSSSNPVIRRLGKFVPGLTKDLVNLQPSLFFLTMVHLIWDDSRARMSPDKGGLGYKPQWTTLAALCKLVAEHKKANGQFETRSMGGGINLRFGLASASRRVVKEIEHFTTDGTLFDG